MATRLPPKAMAKNLVRVLHPSTMLKLLLFTGIGNAELIRLRLTDVDLHAC